MNRAVYWIIAVALLAASLYASIWAVQQCGLGALAYQNPVFAVITGQCK